MNWHLDEYGIIIGTTTFQVEFKESTNCELDELEFAFGVAGALTFEQYFLGTGAAFDPDLRHLVNFNCATQCTVSWEYGGGVPCSPGAPDCFPDFDIANRFDDQTGRLEFKAGDWKVQDVGIVLAVNVRCDLTGPNAGVRPTAAVVFYVSISRDCSIDQLTMLYDYKQVNYSLGRDVLSYPMGYTQLQAGCPV